MLVDDVEGVAKGPIEFGPRTQVELAHRLLVKIGLGNGDDVVAVDHCSTGETLLGPYIHFGCDPSDDPGYGCACHLVQNRNRGIPGEDTYRPSTSRRPEVCPDDVVASYQSGAVSAASRRDASSSAASGGCFVYASMSLSSARAHSSASRTAKAARRRSSERLTSVRFASSSSLATRSSSSCTSTSRLAMTI